MIYFIQVLLAYIVADALSGVYHVLTDNGYNIKSQVEMFQEHHDKPDEFGFDLRPMLGGIPLALFALFGFYPFFWVILGIFVAVVQITHYYAHQKSVPQPLAFLQRYGIILSKQHHNDHHKGDHNANYCILSGWNNWWMNYVVKKGWRSREL